MTTVSDKWQTNRKIQNMLSNYEHQTGNHTQGRHVTNLQMTECGEATEKV